MLNYNINNLINDCLVIYYDTFAHTLDTADYVPEKYNDKILKYIFKKLQSHFRKINKEDRLYQWQIKKDLKLEFKKNKAQFKKKITIGKFQIKMDRRLSKYEIKREKFKQRTEVRDKIKQFKADIKVIIKRKTV